MKTEAHKKAAMRRDASRSRKPPPKAAKRNLQKILDDWDASGKPKTSAYWRLLSELNR